MAALGGSARRAESSSATSSGDRFHVDAVAVDQHRRGPHVADGVDGGSEGEIRHQHRVAGAHAVHHEGEVQGGGAAAQRHRVPARPPRRPSPPRRRRGRARRAPATRTRAPTSSASRSAGPASGGDRKMRDTAESLRDGRRVLAIGAGTSAGGAQHDRAGSHGPETPGSTGASERGPMASEVTPDRSEHASHGASGPR